MITLEDIHARLVRVENRLKSGQRRKAIRRGRELPMPSAMRLAIQSIKRVVSEYYELDVVFLDAEMRPERIVWPRQVAMSLCKKLIKNATLEQIGAAFGGRDHGTVLHACRKVGNTLETIPERRLDMEELESRCALALTPAPETDSMTPVAARALG
jgi:chromosomal replication initiation ATPase DnaA